MSIHLFRKLLDQLAECEDMKRPGARYSSTINFMFRTINYTIEKTLEQMQESEPAKQTLIKQ